MIPEKNYRDVQQEKSNKKMTTRRRRGRGEDEEREATTTTNKKTRTRSTSEIKLVGHDTNEDKKEEGGGGGCMKVTMRRNMQEERMLLSVVGCSWSPSSGPRRDEMTRSGLRNQNLLVLVLVLGTGYDRYLLVFRAIEFFRPTEQSSSKTSKVFGHFRVQSPN
jgi:hypothetical protein